MTLVRPLAIHNLVLPGPTYDMPARMAALFALWNGVSTNWVATLQSEIDTASPGPGSYSFLLSRIGKPNDPQFNYRNGGTKPTPSTTLCTFGINPDGAADPILDPEVPAGPASFFEKAAGFRLVSSQANILVFEFDDAIAVCARHSTANAMYGVHHFGRIGVPRWVDDTEAGAAGLTIGLGSITGRVINGATDCWFGNNGSPFFRLRPGTTSSDDAPGRAWYSAHTTDEGTLIGSVRTSGFSNFAGAVTRFQSPRFKTQYHHLGEWKYIKFMPQSYPLELFITPADGIKWFMSIGNSATAGFLWLPVTETYDPWTPGVYT